MKAILITAANQNMLAVRFNVDPEDLDDVLPIGYWLVTDFGNEETFETVTAVLFEETFTITLNIENGWVAIERVV